MRHVPPRGTATIEALCALLVFFPLWAGVMHLGHLYSTQLENESEARRCAWLISSGACSAAVEGCDAYQPGGMVSEADTMDDALMAVADPGGADGLEAVVSEALGDIAKNLFGERAEVSSGQMVAAPKLLGGGSVEIAATYSLPCNTKPRQAENIAELGFEVLTE